MIGIQRSPRTLVVALLIVAGAGCALEHAESVEERAELADEGVELTADSTAAIQFMTSDRTAEAAFLRSQRFPVPSNARFVSPTGSDTNDGSQARPFRTLKNAIAKTPAGGAIVLREGTYRENDVRVNKTLTIQSFPGEAAFLDGSVAHTGWEREVFGGKTLWWAPLPVLPAPIASCTPGRMCAISAERPIANDPTMLFMNDSGLEQVATKEALNGATFWVDRAARRIYMDPNPTDRKVELSLAGPGLTVAAERVVLRAIGIARYAADGLRVQAANTTVEACSITDNANRGIGGWGSNNLLRNNRVSYNGHNGVNFWQANGLRMLGNLVSYNNREQFNTHWNTSGTKVITSSNLTFENNRFEWNDSAGLWIDEQCDNVRIIRNRAVGNTSGILYEISKGGVVASNILEENEYGVFVLNANTVKVFHNAFRNNRVGVMLIDTHRINDRPERPQMIASGFDWQTHSNEVVNNAFYGTWRTRPTSAIYTVNEVCPPNNSVPGCTNRAVASRINGNLYSTAETFNAPLLSWHHAGTRTNHHTLASLRTIGFEQIGLVTPARSHELFRNAAQGDYRLRLGAPGSQPGVALPADVASAVGRATGASFARSVLD